MAAKSAKPKARAKALKDDGAARHLIAGTRLPDCALDATFDAPVNLARHQERAIIFVYPFTGTPGKPDPKGWDSIAGAHGSTPEAEGFRDHYAAFTALGWDVFGVSGQTSAEQKAFATRVGLPFQLLSDSEGVFAKALQLPTFTAGSRHYLTRLTLLARNGVIYRCVYPVLEPATHAATLVGELTTVNDT